MAKKPVVEEKKAMTLVREGTPLRDQLVEVTWEEETATQVKKVSIPNRVFVHKKNMYKIEAKKVKAFNFLQNQIAELQEKSDSMLSSMKKYF